MGNLQMKPSTIEDTLAILKGAAPITSKSVERCSECERRTMPLFCNLSYRALQYLENIGTRVTLPGDSVIFKEGEQAKDVFILCEGQAKLYLTSRDGHVMILRLASAGDILGLSATLNNTRFEVTAETLEPSSLLSISREEFLAFHKTFGEVAERTSQVLAENYREAFLYARRLALSGSASGRLARLLLDWATTSPSASSSKQELRFTMALTHEELANMTGTSRETVTRTLNRFERDGLIARQGVLIIIRNAQRLNQLAQ
ncbi:MAG: Crp/Fnr family transcriptional regulator [Acidobacteriaceae bacterium]|nr:Crp/Fnr family transcriptional regulator [Acidobacteriaceae bacterium]